MNYDRIKQLAKEQKKTVYDLLALAPGNDPFYVGQPMQKEWAYWLHELWQKLGLREGVHLRRIHYQLVSQDPPLLTPSGKLYENTDTCWDQLCKASKWARYLDLIPIDAFVDRRNPDPIVSASFVPDTKPKFYVNGYYDEYGYSLPQVPTLSLLPDSLPSLPYFHTEGYQEIQQPFLIEIWAEKTTMNDVLEPLCRKYQANLITGMGELSITAVGKDFLARVRQADRPARILYISDFDPAGMGMPVSVARKIEFELYKPNLSKKLDIKLQPIVLSVEQITKYRLPKVPVKDSDKRKSNFQAAYGEGQVELDALEALYPGELAKIVETEILKYYDPSLRLRAIAVESQLLEALEEQQDEVLSSFDTELAEIDNDYRQLLEEFEGTRKEFDELVKPFQDKINAYQGRLQQILTRRQSVHYQLVDEMNSTDVDTTSFPLPVPKLLSESNSVLYDSKRDYLAQLAAYIRRKGNAA